MTRPPDLTDRQVEIIGLLGDGLTVDEIAVELDLARTSVRRKLASAARALAGDRPVTVNELPALLEQAIRAA